MVVFIEENYYFFQIIFTYSCNFFKTGYLLWVAGGQSQIMAQSFFGVGFALWCERSEHDKANLANCSI